MISKKDLAKALLNKTVEVAGDNNYNLIPYGEKYDPGVNETYIKEYCIYGDDNTVGMANNSSDIQFGVYQLSIHTPKTETGYRWKGAEIADVFTSAFSMGLQLTYNGQMVEILKASLTIPSISNTHMVHILSIRFDVIN